MAAPSESRESKSETFFLSNENESNFRQTCIRSGGAKTNNRVVRLSERHLSEMMLKLYQQSPPNSCSRDPLLIATWPMKRYRPQW